MDRFLPSPVTASPPQQTCEAGAGRLTDLEDRAEDTTALDMVRDTNGSCHPLLGLFSHTI